MDTIEQIEFKFKLRKLLKKWRSLQLDTEEIWETLAEQPEIWDSLGKFLHTRLGQSWLKSREGEQFRKWQSG